MITQSTLGTISDLIEYFNMNKHIFQKEKNNKQHMERIMAMLSQQNMKILEKEFQLYTKGLELPTFIYLMKKLYVPEDEISKYFFVSDLIKFFQAIDVNGDGHLQWSQFTEYIIENIRRVQKPNYKNKTFEQNEVISSAYSKISNEYKITKVTDAGASNPIKKIVYVRKQLRYFVLQAGVNAIMIFDDKFVKIDEFSMKGENETSFIIDFAFDQQNEIFCALYDSSARYCNMKLATTIKFMNEVEEKKLKNYHKVEYLPQNQYWAFLSKTGEIKYATASYKSRTQMTYTSELVIKMHDSLVTDIQQIQDPKYIMSSSLDGTIKLYSVMLKKTLTFEQLPEESHSIINTRNKKGVLGIDHTREFGSYVLSYGFNPKIYIYSLDISLTKGYTGKYTQHSGNIISAKFLKIYPYILSFDDKLNLRIWDFRTLQTIQTINCEKNFINPSYLTIIPELSQCLICQKKITQFRTPSFEKKSKQINEFHHIVDFKICSMTNNIFVFTSNDVRVYNYITGELLHLFSKSDDSAFETNITAAQFGFKSRKYYLGDAAGYVRQFDSETGQYLQQLTPPEDVVYEHKAIVRIIFLKQHSLFVACTADGRVMIYERDALGGFQLVRDIRESHQQLICATASVRYCLLATGGQNGTVNIWNLEKFSLQAVLVVKNKVIGLAFSPIHPILMVAEQTGLISFFYVRPEENLANRYKCFLNIQNRDNNSVLQQISSFSFDLIINPYFNKKCSLIKDMSQYKHHFIVTLGQKNGDVIVANLNPIIDKFKIQQNHQIFSTKNSVRCEIQNARTLIANQRNKILMIHGYSNANSQVMSINEFKNRKRFNAHGQQIDQLLLIKQNSIILTTSADKKLKVWSIQGQLSGSVDFFTFKKINWKVSQINFHKKIQAIETCLYAIKLIQNRKFTAKEEEEIKVNLLMNEFMDERQKQDYMHWITIIRRGRQPKIRSRPVTRGKTTQKKRDSNQTKTINDTEKSSDQDQQQMLEKYFREIRINMNQNNNSNRSQQDLKAQTMSDNEFNQICRKLQKRIRGKIQEQQARQKEEWPGDENVFLTKTSDKLAELNGDKKIKDNISPKVQSNKKFIKHDVVNNLLNALVIPVDKDRILSPKEDAEYEKIFKKTLEVNKVKSQKTLRKHSNVLYQNLTEAKRKIDMMTKHNRNKSSALLSLL